MGDTKSRPDLSGILERRRRELSDRPDISARMRKLSASNARNPVPAMPRKSRSRTIKEPSCGRQAHPPWRSHEGAKGTTSALTV